MSLSRLTTAKKAGFAGKKLRHRKDPPKQVSAYMKQKSSFLIAALSLVAFLTGNMVGEHGWYAFWKAALGKYDDSMIAYTGTVPPVAFVPDYSKWAQYGGNSYQDTYRQVPQDDLMPLPAYNESYEKSKPITDNSDVYSVAYMGDYKTGDEGAGSHPAVDIRIPEGTPIRSIANGIVEAVRNDPSGFGLYIVIRHPNVPDPNNPNYATTLHSVYAHLSAQLVTEGEVVTKGEEIGLSGKTGDATGPHLHFQIDRDSAPWHPYWPFTGADMRQAGLTTTAAINTAFHQSNGYAYTVNPMLYVQADYPQPQYNQGAPTTVATATHPAAAASSSSPHLTLAQMVAQRRAERLAAMGLTAPTYVPPTTVASNTQTSSAGVVQKTTVVSDTQSPANLAPAPVIVAPPATPAAQVQSPATTIHIESGRQYTAREWQTIRLTLQSSNGGTTSNTQGLPSKIYMRTAYGDAEFNPSVLTPSDFKNGTATVQMLPRGTKTIVVELQPMGIMGDPMQYAR
ncbi:MAG TPA: M23 family metallopeptidase [Candidatus Peribacteraceae bacterium]|nr:M23 family metallopeptidase [Candidatus Peribacteraceae bacterium]